MFKINRQTDYAIRVVLALAKQPEDSRLSTAEIQQATLVPHAFLQRIVADLARAGLLLTFPGRDGGLQLAHASSAITLKDVMEAIEGPMVISDCLVSPEPCPLDTPCPVQACWGRLQQVILRELNSINFEQLVRDTHTNFSQSHQNILSTLGMTTG